MQSYYRAGRQELERRHLQTTPKVTWVKKPKIENFPRGFFKEARDAGRGCDFDTPPICLHGIHPQDSGGRGFFMTFQPIFAHFYAKNALFFYFFINIHEII